MLKRSFSEPTVAVVKKPRINPGYRTFYFPMIGRYVSLIELWPSECASEFCLCCKCKEDTLVLMNIETIDRDILSDILEDPCEIRWGDIRGAMSDTNWPDYPFYRGTKTAYGLGYGRFVWIIEE